MPRQGILVNKAARRRLGETSPELTLEEMSIKTRLDGKQFAPQGVRRWQSWEGLSGEEALSLLCYYAPCCWHRNLPGPPAPTDKAGRAGWNFPSERRRGLARGGVVMEEWGARTELRGAGLGTEVGMGVHRCLAAALHSVGCCLGRPTVTREMEKVQRAPPGAQLREEVSPASRPQRVPAASGDSRQPHEAEAGLLLRSRRNHCKRLPDLPHTVEGPPHSSEPAGASRTLGLARWAEHTGVLPRTQPHPRPQRLGPGSPAPLNLT